MGLISWLLDQPKDDRWGPVVDLRVSDVSSSHDVEPTRRLSRKHADDPILVTRGWGGYRVHDGNARLQHAREQGRDHIKGRVRK